MYRTLAMNGFGGYWNISLWELDEDDTYLHFKNIPTK